MSQKYVTPMAATELFTLSGKLPQAVLSETANINRLILLIQADICKTAADGGAAFSEFYVLQDTSYVYTNLDKINTIFENLGYMIKIEPLQRYVENMYTIRVSVAWI